VASAGGLAAIRDVLAALPATFPVPIVVLQHMSENLESLLPEILARDTALKVCRAREGALLKVGTVHVAVPGAHLCVSSTGKLLLSHAAVVHFSRPSADTLLRSVAAEFGDQSIVVVLTGAGVDGAEGARAVEDSGGRVIAQDRETSQHFGMPRAAALATRVPLVLPLGSIAPALIAMAGEGVN
jgi:two-component system chemotaxis response regulator CheB